MSDADAQLRYVLRLGDNALINGQRMIERVTLEPELEEELATANFALDYIGQARMFYTYAGEIEGAGRDEDDFAYRREEHDFENLLLLEQPNGHFGDSVVRQFLFESFYVLQLDALAGCRDPRIAEIAARAVKETRYHLRHARQWLVRLGDGTDESHGRVQRSLDEYWRYTDEFFAGDAVDEFAHRELGGPDLAALRERWRQDVAVALADATLAMPADEFAPGGGRLGRHSEHFGFLIAEMQHLQRTHPGARW